MKVGFFVPCHIDALFPQAAISTYELLEKLGLDLEFIDQGACCGLPARDMGHKERACVLEKGLVPHVVDKGYDYVAPPSGICAGQFKDHFDGVEQTPEAKRFRETVHDPVEFLQDALKITEAEGVEGNFTVDLEDLREAAKIQACVVVSGLAVREAGSGWLASAGLGRAACALLSRRLFILLDSAKIKGSLHEACAGLKLKDAQYGSFFSGPSAAADIEAVHITGAQGPLAFTALICNCQDAPEEPELLANPNADSSVWQKEE